VVEVGFEQSPRVRLEAASYEDEQRLRAYLQRASALRALPDAITAALDERWAA
jgi:hypothetical protein